MGSVLILLAVLVAIALGAGALALLLTVGTAILRLVVLRALLHGRRGNGRPARRRP